MSIAACFKLFCFACLIVALSCTGKTKNKTKNPVNLSEIISGEELKDRLSDTNVIRARVKAEIADSHNNPAWLNLDLGDGTLMHVTFNSPAVKLPHDITGKNAIVDGTAFTDTIPAETLRVQAKTNKKPENEISNIKQSEIAYRFVADSYLIK